MGVEDIYVIGDVAFVALNRKRFAVIDSEDVHLVARSNWRFGSGGYAIRKPPRAGAGGRKATAFMHRLMLAPGRGLVVDHINGDRLDNRRANLRVATVAQNNRNQRVRSDNTSGFKGVSWEKGASKWRASLSVDGKSLNLGYYHTPELAHAAYTWNSVLYHGEFGRTS